MRYIALLLSLASVASVAFGCVSYRGVNDPLEMADRNYGYRPSRAEVHRDRGESAVFLAFSGGGTRAAALAYGVMQGLRETTIETEDGTRSMLEEVDTLSGVSGGSFPAAYYGLTGDRIFEEFEPRFLRRNIQGAIILRALIPWRAVALLTPFYTRSDIAKGIYHKSVFDEATFQTLSDAKGPIVYINATDLYSGERFTFTQGTFDLICSDLQTLPIAYAVAASSAVPMLLSPITLRSKAGSCDNEIPQLLQEGLKMRLSDPRRYRAARSFSELSNAKNRYLHLVDGGIADNLGLRAGIDVIEATGGLEGAAYAMQARIPDQLAVISVNAETAPDPEINLSSASPGLARLMSAVSGGQIRRYNFETLLLTHELLKGLSADAKAAGRDMPTFMVEVSFDAFMDPEDRHYFKHIPTSFTLSEKQVDLLIWAGRDLLLRSPEYQRLVSHLGGRLPERKPRPVDD